MIHVEQVKTFVGADKDGGFEPLEHDINKWLADNPRIEITGRKVIGHAYANDRGEPQLVCTVFIFFRKE